MGIKVRSPRDAKGEDAVKEKWVRVPRRCNMDERENEALPMTPNERLRNAREASGKTPAEVAYTVHISESHYRDLEGHRDELYMTVSLAELRNLGCAVGLTIRRIFGVDTKASMDLVGLAEALRHHLVKQELSIQEFEKRAGWDLTKFVENPETAWQEWNFDCLCDVCRELGISWIDVLPDAA